jgi:hypothetical protein
MDYFVASGYLEDLENTVTVDALNGDIAIADSISTSNVQSSNADIGILELITHLLVLLDSRVICCLRMFRRLSSRRKQRQ